MEESNTHSGTDPESQRQPTNMIRAGLDPVVTFNTNGKIVDANEALSRTTGITREKLIGTDITSYFTDPRKAKESNQQAFEKGFVSNHPLTIKHQDGKSTDVLYNASAYKDENGNVLGALAFARDVTDQKIAEERISELNKELTYHISTLKESEEEIGAVFNYAPQGVIVINEKSIITQWNPKATELLGWKKDEVLGKPLYEFIIPERLRRAHIKGVEHFMKTGEGPVLNRMVELPARRKDNSEIDVGVTISPFLFKGKQYFVGFITDITEQKRATQYTRSLIEASLDPFVTISADGKISDANEASAKVTGIPREKLIGTVFSNFFTEPMKAQQAYRLAFERGFVSDFPLTIRHVDGTSTDVLYNASVYKDSKGNVLGVFAAARDITAQKIASRYARNLIEASLDPLLTINADGKITDVNQATVIVTGVRREKLIGTNFSGYFSEPARAQSGYQQAFENGFVADYPLTIRHTNGRLIPVLFNASLYKDEKGNVLGVLATARDITRILALQKEIKESEEFLNSVVENIPNMIFVKDAKELRFVRFNKAGEDLLGYSRDDLLGKNDYDFFPKSQADFFTAKDRDVLKNGKLVDIPEEPIQTKYKGERILHTKKIPIKDKEGNLIYLLGISEDITDRHRALQYARGLIEARPDPILMIDPEGKITEVNEAMVKLTGKARENLIGANYSGIFTEPSKVEELAKAVHENGRIFDYALALKPEHGDAFDVLLNASLLKDSTGKVLGIFAVLRETAAQPPATVAAPAEQQTKTEVNRDTELIKLLAEMKEEIAVLKEQVNSLRENPK